MMVHDFMRLDCRSVAAGMAAGGVTLNPVVPKWLLKASHMTSAERLTLWRVDRA